MIDKETGLIMAEDAIVSYADSLECKNYEEVELALDLLVRKAVRAVEKHRGLPAAQTLCQRVYADLTSNPQVV